jgi:hypothetical protein
MLSHSQKLIQWLGHSRAWKNREPVKKAIAQTPIRTRVSVGQTLSRTQVVLSNLFPGQIPQMAKTYPKHHSYKLAKVRPIIFQPTKLLISATFER